MSRRTPEEESLERPILSSAQLLVEGRTAEIFFREMVEELGLAAAIDVRTFGSITKNTLQAYLELFTAKATFKEKVRKLAVIRDAESQSAETAFQSICAALSAAKLPTPAAMAVLGPGPLQIAVYILPNCSASGMLETLCIQAAAECETDSAEKLLPCVDDFFTCVSRAKTTFDNLTKARFAAYALARGVVDPQLGRAAQKRIIPCNAKTFEKLVEFLKLLSN